MALDTMSMKTQSLDRIGSKRQWKFSLVNLTSDSLRKWTPISQEDTEGNYEFKSHITKKTHSPLVALELQGQ